jgi:hypothetical protein
MTNSFKISPSQDGRTFSFVVKATFRGETVEVSKQVLFEDRDMTVGDSLFTVTNMALVDVLSDGSFSDATRTGYGKTTEILATVAEAVLQFYARYPNEIIYFEGSNPEESGANTTNEQKKSSRTRLYQRMLSRVEYYELVSKHVDLYGVPDEGDISPFKPNDECKAFLIRYKR